MALPINIENLLNKQRIESNRIEFKKNWNPTKVYRSICAFANDFDNIGGGYILIGVEEEHGIAKRPVAGLSEVELDLSEGRATGIPTIQEELKRNGSPLATFETDENRSYFLATIPCHPDFVGDNPLREDDRINDRKRNERLYQMVQLIQNHESLFASEMASLLSVSLPTIWRDLRILAELEVIERIGAKKNGQWRLLVDMDTNQ